MIEKTQNKWGDAQMQVALFMAMMKTQKVRFAPNLNDLPSDEEIDLRCRLILEEALETINAMKRRVVLGPSECGTEAKMSEVSFSKTGEINTIADLAEIADGLADLKVVAVGTDACFGFNADRMFDIVQGNNNAKFRPGHSYDKGKLIKPPDHKAPTQLLVQEIAHEGEAVCLMGTGRLL